MTDDEVRMIREWVDGYLSSKDGRTLDVGNPSHLALLVESARSESADLAEDDLRLVVAMCWLGPQAAGIPSSGMRRELLDILRRSVPDEQARLERVMEFVIAYGCGKWRPVQSGCGGWEHRWQGAMRGLVRALEPAVSQANRWLAEHVVGFPQNRSISPAEGFPEDTAVWSDAWLLATRFIHPEHPLSLGIEDALMLESTSDGTELRTSMQDYQATIPPGAKAVWTVQESDITVKLSCIPALVLKAGSAVFLIARDEDVILRTTMSTLGQQTRLKVGETASVEGPVALAMWECTCGTTHCKERHRLETWDPTQVVQKTVEGQRTQRMATHLTLWDCVAAAVKGPQLSLKTGAFVQGIYFPLLAQEGLTS